jgi:nicotinamide-nucleotide amidase
MPAGTDLQSAAAGVARHLDGRSVATAESFTAGVIAQAFAAVDGSSEWFRGGVVAYQRAVKVALLGVAPSAALVSLGVAEQMAGAVATLLHADVAVATTGAAGPEPLDGAPPGTVAIGWSIDGRVDAALLHFDGDAETVIQRAAAAAFELLAGALRDRIPQP